jgi:hypothetical protein
MSLMALLSDLDKPLITVSLLGSCRGNNYGSWCYISILFNRKIGGLSPSRVFNKKTAKKEKNMVVHI